MSNGPLRLDIVPTWSHFNDELIKLVEYVPDDQINWSPKPELWNFRGILLHTASARNNWLANTVKDGIEAPDVYRTVRSRSEIQESFRTTWARLERFLSNEQQLNATYDGWGRAITGHWIAFHLLEHDVHHRADIFHYLALLGIETPDVGTP